MNQYRIFRCVSAWIAFVVISVSCVGIVWADSADAVPQTTQPEPQPAQSAAEAFAQGRELFEEGDFLNAAKAFERAYAAKPHFSVLCNIALCHERRADFVSAAQFYRRCFDEGAEKTKQAAQVSDSIKRAEQHLATVVVNTNEGGGTVHVDGVDKGPAPLTIALNPGSHVIEVRREGAKPAERTIETRGGEQLEILLTPTPLVVTPPKPVSVTAPVKQPVKPRKRSGLRQWMFWTATGLTAVLGGITAAMGVRTLSLHSDFKDDPTRERYDDGTNARLITNILSAATAVAAAGATTLFFFTDFSGKDAESRGAHTGTTAGIGVFGCF